MAKSYDVVVIGGGPGGYVCAIRAAQLGLKTACVEMRGSLGGTCLNVGCIPSKTLLQSSHLYEMAEDEFVNHGIKTKVDLDLSAMMKRKDKVVDGLTKGIEGLFKKNKVDYLKGKGVITDKGKVEVRDKDGKEGSGETIEAKNIVIATGSESAPLPNVEVDEERIVTSTGALSLKDVPKKMAVIGGGVIGLEMGSVWRRLGSEVTVLEFLDEVLPGMDGEIRKSANKILSQQGLKIKTGTKVTKAEKQKNGVKLTMEPADGGDEETLNVEIVLVAVGRRPYTDGLGLEKAGVKTDDKGFIKIDEHWKAAEGVYAIGDVVGGAMLAHKAEDEGMAVAEIIGTGVGHVNYDAIPTVIYTWPEIAGVGKTEEQLKDAGTEYNSGKFQFMANSRARCNDDTEGFVKVLADKKTDEILGVHIIGAEAGDLIMECVLCIEFEGTAEDIARTCHAHPQLGEAVREAALGVANRMIHS